MRVRGLSRGDRAALIVLVVSLTIIVMYAASHTMIDLRVYRIGGRALLEGDPLYSAHDLTGLPFTYTPFAALLFVPAALLPFVVAKFGAALIAAAALLRVAWLAVRLARREAPDWPTVAGVVVVALLTEPVAANFAFGQVNLLIMWLVLEDLAGSVPTRWRGVLVGIAAGLKLTPGLFVVYFLATRRWADASRAAAAGVITVALGFALQPGQAWKYWTDFAYDDRRIGNIAFAGNQSLHGMIERIAGPNAPLLLWGSACLGVVMLGIWVAAALHRRGDELLAIIAVAFTMLLVSPVSWSHHWVWVVLLIAAATAPARSPLARAWLAAAVAVFVSRCIWWQPYRDGREYSTHGISLLTQNAYALVALALLAWLATVDRREPARLAPKERDSNDGVPRASR